MELLANRDCLMPRRPICVIIRSENTDDFSYYYQNLIIINSLFQCAAGVAYETPC